MSKHPPSLAMSQIIACDAPLLSPVDQHWDQPLFSPTADNLSFSYGYYNLPSPPDSDGDHAPNSPVATARMLKMSIAPDQAADNSQLCMPTHQVFELADIPRPPTPPSRSPSLSIDTQFCSGASGEPSPTTSCGVKRSASPAPGVTKKRAVCERISSKDFIPPDVSGLSKREARLVKNRAAAFLSRQRKREEFECMEVRVQELEQENARLLALSQSGSSPSPPKPQSDDDLVSEVELLKAQLAAAQERERTLSAQLATTAAGEVPIKLESMEPLLPSSPSRPSVPANKSGASLGLMVLLCALPTLLSMRMQPTAPTSFAIPTPFPASSSAFDYNAIFPSEYDWSKPTASSMMDLDLDNYNKVPATRKLEFTSADSTELGGLGDLDISFDTSPSDDGKIRVRIHPSSNPSSRAASPGASQSTKPDPSTLSPSLWTSSGSESPFRTSFSSQGNSLSTSPSDPFLGVSSDDYDIPFATDGSMNFMTDLESSASPVNFDQLSDPAFGLGSSEYSIPDGNGAKRRVRIALKSMPQAGGEGGEWEVQVC